MTSRINQLYRDLFIKSITIQNCDWLKHENKNCDWLKHENKNKRYLLFCLLQGASLFTLTEKKKEHNLLTVKKPKKNPKKHC